MLCAKAHVNVCPEGSGGRQAHGGEAGEGTQWEGMGGQAHAGLPGKHEVLKTGQQAHVHSHKARRGGEGGSASRVSSPPGPVCLCPCLFLFSPSLSCPVPET